MPQTNTQLKNKILPFATTWMDLEGIMLSEVSDRETEILYVITDMWNVKKKKKPIYNKKEAKSQI